MKTLYNSVLIMTFYQGLYWEKHKKNDLNSKIKRLQEAKIIKHCLKLKEAIYIRGLKPELNAQLQLNNDFCL